MKSTEQFVLVTEATAHFTSYYNLNYLHSNNIGVYNQTSTNPPKSLDYILVGCPALANTSSTTTELSRLYITVTTMWSFGGICTKLPVPLRSCPGKNYRLTVLRLHSIYVSLHNHSDVNQNVIIDISIPLNHNLKETHDHKITKYRSFEGILGIGRGSKDCCCRKLGNWNRAKEAAGSNESAEAEDGEGLPAIQKSGKLKTCAMVRNILGYAIDNVNPVLDEWRRETYIVCFNINE